MLYCFTLQIFQSMVAAFFGWFFRPCKRMEKCIRRNRLHTVMMKMWWRNCLVCCLGICWCNKSYSLLITCCIPNVLVGSSYFYDALCSVFNDTFVSVRILKTLNTVPIWLLHKLSSTHLSIHFTWLNAALTNSALHHRKVTCHCT